MGAGFVPFRAKRWHGCRMRGLVQIILFPEVLRLQPYPFKREKGVINVPLKDFAHGPIYLLGKNGVSLEILEACCLATT